MGYKLIDKDGNIKNVGDLIEHDGKMCKIEHLRPPHKPSSSGFVHVKSVDETFAGEYYASVFKLKYVDENWQPPVKEELKGFMLTGEAMQIVYELAEANNLDAADCETDELKEAKRKQDLALATVHDFITNNFGENDDAILISIEMPLETIVDTITNSIESGWCSEWFIGYKLQKSSEEEYSSPWYAAVEIYNSDLEVKVEYDDPDNPGNTADKIITMADIRKGLQIMAMKYPKHFGDMKDENGDAITADVFMQCIIFGEAVYG